MWNTETKINLLTNLRKNLNFRFFTIVLLSLSFLFYLLNAIFGELIYHEIDTNALPVISIQYNHSIISKESDIELAQKDFPNLYKNISSYDDLRASKLLKTKNNNLYSYYFPLYSALCVPTKIVLQLFGISQERCFSLTNLILFFLSLFVIYKFLKLDYCAKFFLILFIVISPCYFYINYICYEMTVASFTILSMVLFHNKRWKLSSVCLAIASLPQPTIMALGFPMIFYYFIENIRNNKNLNLFGYLKKEFYQILLYALSFTPCFIPFVCRKLIVGNKEFFASLFTTSEFFSRALAYIFDFDFGLLSFFPLAVFVIFISFFICIKTKNCYPIIYLVFFLSVLSAMGFNIHINCGMIYCARYLIWSYPLLCFFIAISMTSFTNLFLFRILLILVSLSNLFLLKYNAERDFIANYVCFKASSRKIFNYCPALYNPLFSTFNSKINHYDGGYDFKQRLPIIYKNSENEIRKILIDKSFINTFLPAIVCDEETRNWLTKRINGTSKLSYISIPLKYKIYEYLPLKINQVIYFNNNENFPYSGNKYCVKGLSSQEYSFTWTEGTEFKMMFNLDGFSPDDKAYAKIDLAAVLNGNQRVNILINGENIYENSVSNGENVVFDFIIPNDKTINLTIELPDACSPYSLGINDDKRLLALALKDFVISAEPFDFKYPKLPVDNTIVCNTSSPNYSAYVSEGLWGSENTHNWSKDDIKMAFKLSDVNEGEKVKMHFDLMGVFNGQQSAIVYLNGSEIAKNTLKSGENLDVDFICPKDGKCNFEIIFPEAISPQKLGVSEDGRDLAIAVRTISLYKNE